MNKTIKILSVFILLISMAGCSRVRFNDDVVARVGDARLRKEDVKVAPRPHMTPEDSTAMAEAYVNNWIRKQIKIQEAEKVLATSDADIDGMVNDYRNSLLTHMLDQYYVAGKLDTVVTDSVVADYYEQHRSEFLLERPLVKGRILRVPNSYRQQAKLKELMGSAASERQQDFNDLVVKNNFDLNTFENWTDFQEFLTYLPTTRGKSYDQMLTSAKVQEMSDADNKYYVQITEQLPKGGESPLERVDNIIRRITYTQRSNDIIKNYEDSLYQAAYDNNLIKQQVNNR